jgi:hypothetical protein
VVSTSLAQYLSKQVNAKMPAVLADIRKLRTHLDFLKSVAELPIIEAREVLNAASQAKETAIRLRIDLVQVAEFRSSVRRRHLGSAYQGFAANYSALSRQIENEFNKLDSAIRSLDHAALDRLHDPGRHGDAAAEGAVTELVGLLGQILDFWRLLIVNKKLED